MIVTVANCALPESTGVIAENLALLRARSSRNVVFLNVSQRQVFLHWSAEQARRRRRPTLSVHAARGHDFSRALERLLARSGNIVIDTGTCDSHECRCALIAAQVAVVPLAPLAPQQADIDAGYEVIAQLNSARMFNPGLRVLFVTAGSEPDPAPRELYGMRDYAAQAMAASLAGTIVHLPALLLGADAPGCCASNVESSTGAAELAALYREVYKSVPAAPPFWRACLPA